MQRGVAAVVVVVVELAAVPVVVVVDCCCSERLWLRARVPGSHHAGTPRTSASLISYA